MKNQTQKIKKWLKSKKAFAVDTAIKVLTAVVLGALILMGLYGIINGAVMPKTKDKIDSMYAITDTGVDTGDSGGGALPGEGGVPGTGGGGVVDNNINHGLNNKIIPEGGEYKVNGSEIQAQFPTVTQNGDTYTYNGITYKYNYQQNENRETSPTVYEWALNESQNGWGVSHIDSSTCPKILKTVNGQPIVNMNNMFMNGDIIISPDIPEGVKTLNFTFSHFSPLNANLTTPPSVIPKSVIDMGAAFLGCNRLKGTIIVDASFDVSNGNLYNSCFWNAGTGKGSIILTSNIKTAEQLDRLNKLAATNLEGNVVVDPAYIASVN